MCNYQYCFFNEQQAGRRSSKQRAMLERADFMAFIMFPEQGSGANNHNQTFA